MQRNRLPMFLDSASSTNLLSLYICRAENVLGRVTLMPCYIPPCPTVLETGLELQQIPVWGEATESGSMSSTSGC